MAYTKQTWQDLPSKTTPINASRLGHIEQGIYDAASTADTAASNASSAISGLADKVDKVEGKGLSTNDFTDALKTKLDGIATGAEVNVQSDWNQSDNSADDYIKNKPSLGTASAKNSTSVITDSSDLVESGAVYTALQGKCDNSVIAPVENGTTASQAYAVGSHAIRNGKFITWKNAKAQGETINDASDYTSGDVADELDVKEITVTAGTNVSVSSSYNKVYKQGNMIFSKIRFTISSAVASNTVICTMPNITPMVNYPMFDIRTQETPYSIVSTAFVSPNNELTIVHYTSNPLQAGTYEVTFSFICK